MLASDHWWGTIASMARQKKFQSEVVRLADLAIVDTMLDGYEFNDCLLMGPAVVILTGEIEMDGINIGGDVQSVFWLIEPGRSLIVGGIAFTNSKFIDVRFQGVGFAGHEDFRELLLSQVES